MGTLIVCKAGGWITKDAATINRFVREIKADPGRRIVVPSAPGARGEGDKKVTDLLLDYVEASGQPKRTQLIADMIRLRFTSIMRCAQPSVELIPSLRADMETWGSASKDHVVSRGEYWIARILAELRELEFIDATEIVRFDENGHFDLEATRKNANVIKEALRRSPGVVMPGFYGAMPDGTTIKLFPRNATDLSAAIVAELAEAAILEIWKKTSIRLASPTIVKSARASPYLSYEEGVALNDRGSEVVYGPAVELMRTAGIPIHVIGIDDPPGEISVIDSAENVPAAEPGSISSIASRKHMSILTFKLHGMHEEVGVLGKIFQVLTELGIRVHHPLDGIDIVDAIVETEAVNGLLSQIAKALENQLKGLEFSYASGRALITVVGRGLADLGSHVRILQSLVRSGIERGQFSQGSEPHVFTLLVYMVEHETAVRAIYREFA